jgi:uncharacterized protein (DUF433 family)
MRLEDYFDFSEPGAIRIQGHRVWIEHVLYPYIFEEKTAEEIHKDLATLSLEQIHATILYYLQNKEAVDQYIKDWLEYGRKAREEDRRNRPEFYALWRKRKEEWLAKRRQTVDG